MGRGYCTFFSLEVIGGDSTHDYSQEIRDMSGYPNLFEDSVKWYSHQEDMRSFSKKYPEVLFILSGEGEDPEDMWKEYHKNGLMQKVNAEITFEEFNETKLT
jgi:ABC-type Fe3+-hydroxamate transport system substrate-binding protein